MSDEAALLNAIVAHADEDTPRLAYADWLDENEAPIQAEFIRTQCRLAACSAADPDYPDLIERHAELVAQFGPMIRALVPELPPGFAFDSNLENGVFRHRGFPHAVHGQWDENWTAPEDDEIEQFCSGLRKLIETTTARELFLKNVSAKQLAQVLAAPGAEAVTGLEVSSPQWTDDEEAAFARAVASSKCAGTLERLCLSFATGAESLVPLAAANFDRLIHLDLPQLLGRADDIRPVVEAKWFRALRTVHARGGDEPMESALLTAFAEMPHLESLNLQFSHADALRILGAARAFPSLARLAFWPGSNAPSVARMAKRAFPRLAELDMWMVQSGDLTALLTARWLPRLRVLALRNGALSDKSVVAFSKSPAVANLRILRLTEISVGNGALAALGNGVRFPNLTTLELTANDVRKKKPVDLVAFAAAFSLPRVRHLDLSGWPLGDAGAKALAANPALANLTRLALRRCGIGEKGLTALVRSPHLQQLIELDVSYNELKTASALRNTRYLPRLAAARLDDNSISPTVRTKLHAARGLAV